MLYTEYYLCCVACTGYVSLRGRTVAGYSLCTVTAAIGTDAVGA